MRIGSIKLLFNGRQTILFRIMGSCDRGRFFLRQGTVLKCRTQALKIIFSVRQERTVPCRTLIAEKLRDSAKAEIACTGGQFTCRQQYICRPPDICTFSFACPGRYVPSFPQGGGGCQFFACGPFQFGQPCGPFTFGQPCGPFQFGGSQCGVPGGFICPGQQFIGAVGPPGSQCGVPGGFTCPGFQFAGAPVMPPPGTSPGMGPISPLPPIPPMELSVKGDQKDKEKKE